MSRTLLHHFNSIKVRLEPTRKWQICIFVSYFNSIKVRLERLLQFCVSPGLSFQFHKGAIRTLASSYLPIFHKFQFHKGAIRTSHQDISGKVNRRFQFHKGAIRTQLLPIFCEEVLPFQFHKGAIRTQSAMANDEPFAYFNSIKVRLERSTCHLVFSLF